MYAKKIKFNISTKRKWEKIITFDSTKENFSIKTINILQIICFVYMVGWFIVSCNVMVCTGGDGVDLKF